MLLEPVIGTAGVRQEIAADVGLAVSPPGNVRRHCRQRKIRAGAGIEWIVVRRDRRGIPGAIVLVGDLHDQHVVFPAPPGVAHPGLHPGIQRRLVIDVDQPIDLLPFEGDRHVRVGLKNLEGELQGHDPGHARQEAVGEWIRGCAILEIDLPALRRPGLIGNLPPINDVAPGRHFVAGQVVLEIV